MTLPSYFDILLSLLWLLPLFCLFLFTSLCLRNQRDVSIKSFVIPTFASIIKNITSDAFAASNVCSIIANSIWPSSCRASCSVRRRCSCRSILRLYLILVLPFARCFETQPFIRLPLIPAVSINLNIVPPILPQHSLLSRVVPATSETTASLLPSFIRRCFPWPNFLRPLKLPAPPLFVLLFLLLSLPKRYALFNCLHSRRLNNVDLPALGGPKIDTFKGLLVW